MIDGILGKAVQNKTDSYTDHYNNLLHTEVNNVRLF
jgi:hypothetical protein